jgi:mannosylglycerate hydrolase
MKANKIIVVPETHWDREWYLPFQEFRARLVLMMDDLLEILKNKPEYSNFTFDGQTIPIEDYLEVRPQAEEHIKKFVEQRRLSIGPFYVLPDEFLISGESIIRNLMIGHQIAKKFGRVMKAGYIPDPFGHIAQLPQIIAGFDIPSVLFWRGFGNEFEDNNLNMEFIWNAPGNASSVFGIHLIKSYGSFADFSRRDIKGVYKSALRKARRLVSEFEKHTATPVVLLNNGSDHHEALPEIPDIVVQWNDKHPDKEMIQNDFEYYIDEVMKHNPDLKSYTGELRGSKYAYILAGVFSARMWIKQRNTEIEYLYEKYSEPMATITWALDKYNNFEYPKEYLLTGLKWLIKNHPHDSICGCSIDEVHDEMATRFDWAEQIAEEIYKNSSLYLFDLIDTKDTENNNKIPFIVFNPLPWNRKEIVEFNGIAEKKGTQKFSEDFKLIDSDQNEIPYQGYPVEGEPRYTQEDNIENRFSFLADLPACGYKIYYLVKGEAFQEIKDEDDDFKIDLDSIENEFYRIEVQASGQIDLIDKQTNEKFESICFFEDVGDWGDEYDFSGPKENQTDLRYTTLDAVVADIMPVVDGPTQKTLEINMHLKLPVSLSEDRYRRQDILIDNEIRIFISLYKDIKRIDFKIELENRSRDHRIRALFPTKIQSNKVYADGHFYIVPRSLESPDSQDWVQQPPPTNHQKDFVAINDNRKVFAVLNKGLPEYEPIINENGTTTLAITLLRCVGWLSREKFESRKANAGPNLSTPGAQGLGTHTFELSIYLNNSENDILKAKVHKEGKEFNNPPKVLFPSMTRIPLRISDKIILKPLGLLSYFVESYEKKVKSYLPENLSFLTNQNDNILLSILKRAEKEGKLIVRVYNLSDKNQEDTLRFFEKILIENVQLVNLLEEESTENQFNTSVVSFEKNLLNYRIGPHAIVTFKISLKID